MRKKLLESVSAKLEVVSSSPQGEDRAKTYTEKVWGAEKGNDLIGYRLEPRKPMGLVVLRTLIS